MQDEESREIFMNRLMFSITGDEDYINTIIKKFTPFPEVNRDGAVRYLLFGIDSRDKKYPLVVYGCGEMASLIAKKIGTEISFFCDRNPDRQKNGFLGKRVLSLEELIDKKNEVRVLIGSVDYYLDIYDMLEKNNIIFATDNRKQIGDWLQVVNEQYFDPNIIHYGENEIFIDGGCLNYGTVKQFLANCSTVKKVYAFEPDPLSYNKCVQEAKSTIMHDYLVIQKGLYSDSQVLFFNSKGNGCSGISSEGSAKVEVCAIDHEIQDSVTFIKMDIEGAELDALKGARHTICSYHPKLAICVYHKPEDIIEIPQYLLSINPDYRLYLRHYSDNAGETVLYAV